MKITYIDIYRFSIRMEPFVIATGTMDFAQNMFIRVHTDAGFYGVGECSAFPMIVGETQETCLLLARDFARIWIGKDPLQLEERLLELDAFIAKNPTAKSAFDMALYDIAAKNQNLPLYRFFGGEKRTVETDITIGIGDAVFMAQKALEFKNLGATILKVKVGKDAEKDIGRIQKIREAVGPEMKIRIDANQGWNMEDAIIALQGMAPFDIQFCEQPLRTWFDDYLPQLKKISPIKIMADESVYNAHDARRQIKTESCDYINIKLAKSGGMLEAKKIHDLTAAYKIPCMMGGMLESRIGLSANLHFAMAHPNIQFFDLDTCMLGHLEDPCVDGVNYDSYFLSIKEAPGIGADADEVFLEKCEHWQVS